MISHPTPWRIEGDTIRDAAGGVVVSALNPCNMSTRRKIVDAVNEHDALKQRLKDAIAIAAALNTFCNSSSLAAGAMENPETESLKTVHSRTGEYVPRAGEVENTLQPHGMPCVVPPFAPGTCPPSGGKADGENRDGDPTLRGETDRETHRKMCGEKPSGFGLARGHGEPFKPSNLQNIRLLNTQT